MRADMRSDLGVQPVTVFESESLWPHYVRINLQLGSHLYVFKVDQYSASLVDTVSSISAVPVISTRHRIHDTLLLQPAGTVCLLTSGGRNIPINLPKTAGDSHDDVARRMASSLSMQVDADHPTNHTHSNRRIVGLEHAASSRVTLVYEDGERVRVSTDFTIRDPLVRQCFEAISLLPRGPDFFIFKRELLGRMQRATKLDRLEAWTVFVDTLRDMLDLNPARVPVTDLNRMVVKARQSRNSLARRLGAKCEEGKYLETEPRQPRLLFGTKLDRTTDTNPILVALHLVAQDRRCMADGQQDTLLLGSLLLEISGKQNLVSWWDYWRRRMPRGEYRLESEGA